MHIHHPVAVLADLAVMAFLIAVLVTKRPHNTGMKAGMAVVLASMGVWSVYGMAHQSVGTAILFGVILVAILAWMTIKKGWPEWWAKL
jgi:Zn-dependent protease